MKSSPHGLAVSCLKYVVPLHSLHSESAVHFRSARNVVISKRPAIALCNRPGNLLMDEVGIEVVDQGDIGNRGVSLSTLGDDLGLWNRNGVLVAWASA